MRCSVPERRGHVGVSIHVICCIVFFTEDPGKWCICYPCLLKSCAKQSSHVFLALLLLQKRLETSSRNETSITGEEEKQKPGAYPPAKTNIFTTYDKNNNFHNNLKTLFTVFFLLTFAVRKDVSWNLPFKIAWGQLIYLFNSITEVRKAKTGHETAGHT